MSFPPGIYLALFLVLISRSVWCLILVHFYLSSLFLLCSKIVFGIVSTCFYTKKAKISLFSHHWRTSDLVPYVLLLVQTKVSHLSTLAHFNFRARTLSWLKLQTRPQFFICLVLCLLPGVLVSCLLPNSGSLDAMVSQGYLMPGKGGEGDRSIRVMQIDPPLSRNKDRTEEVQSYNFSPIAHNPAFLPLLSSAGFKSCAVFKPQ